MYKLVISDDEGKTIIVPLVRDLITVGRQDGNTIRLTERNVSRQHARLVRNEHGFRIEDLESYNGVIVNGSRIEAAVELRDGDRVGVGDYIIALKSEGDLVQPAPPQPMRASAPSPMVGSPPARFVMISAPAPGAEFSIAKPQVRIGRLEELDLCISHRSISREHARVLSREGSFEIEDLNSANGIRINGSTLKRSPLRSGDIVELGQVRFRFVGPGESYTFDPTEEEPIGTLPMQRGPKKSTAVLVLGSALALAVGAALLQQDGTPAGAANRPAVEPEPQAQPVMAVEPVAAPVAPREPVEARAGCSEALAAGRFADAVKIADDALLAVPDTELASCKAKADTAVRAESAYQEGKQALSEGKLEDAYFLFAGIPDDSAYRSRPDVVDTTRKVAQERLLAARKELRSNPTETKRLASSVLEMHGLAAVVTQEAERLLAMAGATRQNSAPAAVAAPKAAPKSEPADPEESPAKAARNCLARGDQRCVVKALEGHADNAQELALLIETYRALGDVKKAVRHMETFVQRFPSARQAPQYRQFIVKHE